MNQQNPFPSHPEVSNSLPVAEASTDRQEVLVVVSVILDAPIEFEPLQESLEQISDALHQALQQVAAAHPGVRSRRFTAYHYLDDPETNAHHCDECGKWTTNPKLPEAISALPEGFQVGTEYFCDECAYWGRGGLSSP